MAQGGILSLKGASIDDYVTVTKTDITINLTAIGTDASDNVTAFNNLLSRLDISTTDLPFTSTFTLATSDFAVKFSNLNTQKKLVNFLRVFRHIALPGTDVSSDYATILQKAATAMATHTDILALLLAGGITVVDDDLTLKFDMTTAFAGYTVDELDAVIGNWTLGRAGANIALNPMFASVLNAGTSYDVTLTIDSASDLELATKVFESVNNPTTVTDGAGLYGPYDYYAMAKTIGDALLA